MVGLVGRSSFLLSCRLGQYSRRCSVVSAGLSQWWQCSGLLYINIEYQKLRVSFTCSLQLLFRSEWRNRHIS